MNKTNLVPKALSFFASHQKDSAYPATTAYCPIYSPVGIDVIPILSIPSFSFTARDLIYSRGVLTTLSGETPGPEFYYHESEWERILLQNEVSNSIDRFEPTPFTSSSGQAPFFLGGWGQIFFGHWVFEILPRVSYLAAESASQAVARDIIVSSSVPNTFLRLLQELFSWNHRIVRVDPRSSVIFHELTLSRCSVYRCQSRGNTLSFDGFALCSLQKRIDSLATRSEANYVLLLVRPEYAPRRCVNSVDIFSMLEQAGYSVVLVDNIESYSVARQIDLIFNASIVVEEAGSSLPFTILAKRPRTPHVVFGPSSHTVIAMRALSSFLGSIMVYVTGEIIQEESQFSARAGLNEHNYRILTKEFACALTMSLSLATKDPLYSFCRQNQH